MVMNMIRTLEVSLGNVKMQFNEFIEGFFGSYLQK